eukprot:1072594-Karenia_brevis.AAC.1
MKKRGEFHWYFSSSVSDEDRDKAEKLRQTTKNPAAPWNKVSEKRGVAMVIHDSLHTPLETVIAADNNNIIAKFNGRCPI